MAGRHGRILLENFGARESPGRGHPANSRFLALRAAAMGHFEEEDPEIGMPACARKCARFARAPSLPETWHALTCVWLFCAAAAARNLWRQRWLLPPTSPNIRRWESFLWYAFLVNLVILPIDVFFYHRSELKPAFDSIDWTIDFFFFVDFCVRFRRTHRLPETDDLETDWHRIARRYLRSWAFADAVAFIPWDLLLNTGANANANRLIKMFKLLRASMLRRTFGGKAGKSGKNVNLKLVLKVLFYFILIAHWVGSTWWFVGMIETEWALTAGADPLTYAENWQQRIPQMRWNSPRSTKLSKESSFAQQYWSSLYWSFTALVKVRRPPRGRLRRLAAACAASPPPGACPRTLPGLLADSPPSP